MRGDAACAEENLMERVLISVYVPQRVAVLSGISEYGEMPYAPTDDELGSLSVAQRDYIFRRFVSGSSTLKLDTAPPTWAGIVRALSREIAGDAEFQARQAELRRNHDADSEARLIAAEQAKVVIMRWAVSIGSLCTEGQDMEQRLIDKVHDRICEKLGAFGIPARLLTRIKTGFGRRGPALVKLSDQKSPDERAHGTLRTVSRALEQIEDLPGCVSMFARIRRCEVDDELPYRRRFTAVTIDVTCPCWQDSMVIVNTEEEAP